MAFSVGRVDLYQERKYWQSPFCNPNSNWHEPGVPVLANWHSLSPKERDHIWTHWVPVKGVCAFSGACWLPWFKAMMGTVPSNPIQALSNVKLTSREVAKSMVQHSA